VIETKKMPENLHWSVDYAYHHSSNGDFRKQLWSCLEKSLCDGNIRCSLSEKKHHYTILPNFWNGYQPSLPDQGIGQATVHRNQESQSIWHYNIYCDNISNGAEMRLDFRAQTNVQPTVVDKWHVHVKSHADGIYDRFDCIGSITNNGDQKQISLEMRTGLVIPAGEVSSSSSIICDWMLFDWIPTLAQESAAWAMLEDLQRLKPNHHICRLEDWEFELDGHEICLRGYSVYGQGTEVSYWWLNEANEVVLISKTFSTYVLTKGGCV